MSYSYLVDPNNQFMTKSGTINVAGHIRVYMAATDDIATTYKDFSGTLNPAVITLDDNGRCVIIADNETAYRIEVYDRYDSLLWTQEPVWCMAAGGGVSFVRVQSSDGTIVVNTTTEGSTTVYDLSTEVEKEPAPYGTSQLDVNALYATGEQFVALPWTSFGGDLTTNDGAWVIPYDAIADVDTDVVVTYDASLPKSSIFVRMEVEYGNESMALPTRELDMSQDCPSVHFSFKVPVHEGDTLTYKVYYQCAEGVTCGLDARSWLNLEVNNLGDDPNNDYNLLVNKPSINGVELVGDKSGSDLHLQDKLTEGQYINIDSANVISVSGLQPVGDYVYNSSFTSYTADASTSFVQQSSISSIENNITSLSAELSGKLDATASSMFQSAGNYQTAGNYQSAGDYAFNSSLSSKLDATASSMFQSAGNYQSAGDYAFNSALSSKVDKSAFDTCCNEVKSAISGKLDTSAFESYTATATLTGDYLENSSFNIYSASANSAFVHTADMSGYQTKLEWGYDGQNNITSVDGSAFKAGGADYSGIDPIHVDNTARTIFVDHTGLSIDETMTAFPSGSDIVIGVNQDILSGKMDATASSNFYPSDNPSGFISSVDLTPYQPTSSMTAYQAAGDYLSATESSNYYPASNPSGFISSVDLSNYATTAYVDSSVSSKLDATASSNFYPSDNPSGFISSVDLTPYQPTSSMTAYQAAGNYLSATESSNYYPTSNPSGFISSVDLSNYATTAYVDSSISGFAYNSAVSGWTAKQDALTFGYDTADKISGINGSALAGEGGGLVSSIGTSESGITSINNSGLVDTAALHSSDYSSLYVQEPLYISASGDSSYIGISGNVGGVDSATCSAIASAYAESAVSAASSNYYPATSNPSGYLTAQAQASWSESASASPSYIQDKPDLVDIVAGPGIVVDNPDGNTLRVSMATDYEVTLFENASGTTTNIVCSEKMSNFDRVRFYLYPSESNLSSEYTTEFAGSSTIFKLARIQYNDGGNFPFVIYGTYYSTTDSKTITIGSTEHIWFGPSWTVGGTSTYSPIKFVKIVGVNRIANN